MAEDDPEERIADLERRLALPRAAGVPDAFATSDRLTPEQVHNVAFSKPPLFKRGYDEDEVDAYLRTRRVNAARPGRVRRSHCSGSSQCRVRPNHRLASGATTKTRSMHSWHSSKSNSPDANRPFSSTKRARGMRPTSRTITSLLAAAGAGFAVAVMTDAPSASAEFCRPGQSEVADGECISRQRDARHPRREDRMH